MHYGHIMTRYMALSSACSYHASSILWLLYLWKRRLASRHQQSVLIHDQHTNELCKDHNIPCADGSLGTGLGWHADYPYHDIDPPWPPPEYPLGCQVATGSIFTP